MAKRRKKKFPLVPLAIGAGVVLLASGAFASVTGGGGKGGGGGGGGGGGSVPGIPAGRYTVTTQDTGPAGNLALRGTPSVDPTNANLLEWLPHGSSVQASGKVDNGFAAVLAPDGQSGWASLNFLTLA